MWTEAAPSTDAKKREALEIIVRPQRHAGSLAHRFDVQDAVGVLKIEAARLAEIAQPSRMLSIKIPLLGLRAQFHRRIASAPVQPHVK